MSSLWTKQRIIPLSRVKDYVNRFNNTDDELTVQLIPNSEVAEYLSEYLKKHNTIIFLAEIFFYAKKMYLCCVYHINIKRNITYEFSLNNRRRQKFLSKPPNRRKI
jgi:hypothetical protein